VDVAAGALGLLRSARAGCAPGEENRIDSGMAVRLFCRKICTALAFHTPCAARVEQPLFNRNGPK